MATTTTNLALTKSLGTENYSIDIVNDNLDKIDGGCVNVSKSQTITGAKEFTANPTLYTTGFSEFSIRSTRTSGNIGAVGFYDYYQGAVNQIISNFNGNMTLKLHKSNSCVRLEGQRAYSSSNTDDVVTIGSLQASTDVVHRSGDETVNGSKGFAGELYVPGVFTYKTKLFSGNNNYGGKYNRIAVLTPGSLGGAVVGMIWSSKGHNSTFRNRNGIIYMRARPSSGLLDFIWMAKGSGIANEQLALTYNGTNVELWGLCDTDSANESLVFSLMSEANSGGSATNIFAIAEDLVKTRAEIVAYTNYSFSG